MSVELLAMLGGSLSGFVMKLIAAQTQSQAQMPVSYTHLTLPTN